MAFTPIQPYYSTTNQTCDSISSCLRASQLFDGEIELDESNEGGIRKGKRKDTKQNTLIPIIKSKIKPDSVVYTDSYKSYNALDVSDFRHFRINHSTEFAKDHNHRATPQTSGLKPKEYLESIMTLTRNIFIFLSKTEFRFNDDTPSNQLKVLRRWCGGLG